MRSLPRALALAALLSATLACENPSASVHVDVVTDLVPALELGSVEAELRAGDTVIARSAPIAPAREDAPSWLVGGVRIASFDHLASGLYTVRVVGREPAAPGLPLDGGPRLVERSVLISLASSRVVRVVLGARCTDLVCPDGDELELTACLNGHCVAPTCDVTPGEVCDAAARCAPEDPEACSPGPACATVTCRDGACLNEPIPGACADDEYCGRDGCEPIPGAPALDAGVSDAFVEIPDAYEVLTPDAAGPCGAIGDTCDDGNPCTTSDHCTASGCTGTPRSGTTCGTQSECRADRCMDGVCTRVAEANGTACGTRNDCRRDACRAGACERNDVANGTSCGPDTACRNDVCRAGVCNRVDARSGTACNDGDGNACTTGECNGTGACRATRRADGSSCGGGNDMCCSGNCINPSTNGAHCGACGVSCGGRGCHAGLCHCSTNPQCAAELGAGATCWATDVPGDTPTDGMHCQCQCASGTTCAACPGAARCREVSGYNHCYYP